MSFKNYYLILDIKKNATADEIKKAYRKQAMKWHPDKNNFDTTEIMQNICEAYMILKDVDARKLYDKEYDIAFGVKPIIEKQEADYIVEDENLNKWMNTAKKQAVGYASQTIRDIRSLSIIGAKAAGDKIRTRLLIYLVIAIILFLIANARWV